MAVQASGRTGTLPAGTRLQSIRVVIDFEDGMIRWKVIVDVYQVVSERFTGTVGEVTTRIGPDKGTESTRRLHVALKAYVLGECRGQIGWVEDRVSYLLICCIGRVGKFDVRFPGSMASLAAYASGKFRGERIGMSEHVSTFGNGWIGVVAEHAFSRHLASQTLVVGMVETR